MVGHELIAVGASAGGIEAVGRLCGGLPADLPASLCVVVHISDTRTSFLAEILQRRTGLQVSTAVHGEPIRRGRVYVAPANRHLLVERGRVVLSSGAQENRARPAVDPLFRSVAEAYGPHAVGVVLTGNLDDGTAGLAAIQARGGVTVVQEPADAPFPSMPLSALRRLTIDHALPLDRIPELLVTLARQPPVARPDDPSPEASPEAAMHVVNGAETRADIVCPRCHGAMTQLPRPDQRYRCHIGHAFGVQSLLAEQLDDVDRSLESALRGLEEIMRLGGRMLADLAPDDPLRREVGHDLDLSEQRATQLRRLLGEGP